MSTPLKLVIVAVIVVSSAWLPAGDRDYLRTQSLGSLIDRVLEWVAEQPGFAALESIDLVVIAGARMVPGPDAEPELAEVLPDRLARFADQHGKTVQWVADSSSPRQLTLIVHELDDRDATRLTAEWTPADDEALRVEMEHPFYRSYALLPPLLAIALALTFRQTLLALFAGVWVGATMTPWFESSMTMTVTGLGAALEGGGGATPVPQFPGTSEFPNPLLGLWRFVSDYFWKRSLLDTFRVEIIGFVAVLIAAVGVMTRGGAIAGLVEVIVRFARTVRTTRIATVLMGCVIFFDDYTNAIIVGNTMRPLTDRMRISREKLAYLVDSTAAPVAGIMVLSTWVAYEVSQFAPQLEMLGIDRDPYGVFISTIPYRFYCLFTLFFVFASTLMSRDFGPMLRAELRAASTGQVLREGGRPLVAARATNMVPIEGAPKRWINAALPLLVVIGVTIVQIVRLGVAEMEGPVDLLDAGTLREVLANSNTAKALFHGSIAGWLCASLLLVAQRILTPLECVVAGIRGAGGVVFALAILFLAWSIGEVCGDLGTAHVLIALFKGNLSPYVLPMTLFVLSCAVAFSTGSSWSTMAIILPNTVMLAYAVGETYPAGPLQLTILSIGAVLEGSIFGDHCSPISDTTILSSVASASDHIDHVRTQIPYAMTTMAMALLVGYLPAALGVSPLWCFLCGAALLLGVLIFFGRPVDAGRRAA